MCFSDVCLQKTSNGNVKFQRDLQAWRTGRLGTSTIFLRPAAAWLLALSDLAQSRAQETEPVFQSQRTAQPGHAACRPLQNSTHFGGLVLERTIERVSN